MDKNKWPFCLQWEKFASCLEQYIWLTLCRSRCSWIMKKSAKLILSIKKERMWRTMKGLHENDLLDGKMAYEIWNTNAQGKRNPDFVSKISSELIIPTQKQDFQVARNRSLKMPALCSSVIKRLNGMLGTTKKKRTKQNFTLPQWRSMFLMYVEYCM